MTNLASILLDSAAAQRERIAIRHAEAALTYHRLDDASSRVAALLRGRGLEPGERVALAMPNVPLFPIVYYGILRAGGVVVPVNPLLKTREVAFTLRDSGARLAIAAPQCAGQVAEAAAEAGTECLAVETAAWDDLLDAAAPMPGLVDRAPDDTAVILYTSGTTGTPKGAELTHRNLLSNTATTVETLIRIGPDDVVFGGLPLFHAFGQTCALNTVVAAGATLTLLPRFDPWRALEIMRRDRVTVFLGVPTMYAALLHTQWPAGYDAAALRMAVSGGAALPVEVLHGFEERFGVAVLEGYGLSETSPVAAFNPPDRPRKAGSIGLPVRGVELRLMADDGGAVPPGEVGELAIRGENVMKGYWNHADATADALREGWFHSGDLARVDDEGYYFVVDRKKDLIIRGGYNVYPREIEELLYGHPAVAEAAVVGVPHPVHGEEVAAVVVLRAGADDVAAEAIRDYVKDRLAAYKYPRIVTFATALPKGATGKILKREIVVPASQPAPGH
ncbi:long-chain fatty acid--CoA ligase [Embleya sp. NPDC056575]|uniref:long-chain-fatty-acid--CoA ligase n=1 Tax=unclassified Embleya TaxID=2699296 RepID=UPI00369C0EB6